MKINKQIKLIVGIVLAFTLCFNAFLLLDTQASDTVLGDSADSGIALAEPIGALGRSTYADPSYVIIAGRVWVDDNKDGIRQPSETSTISNVEIKIGVEENGTITPALDIGGNPVPNQFSSAIAGTYGQYSFFSLPALTPTQRYAVEIVNQNDPDLDNYRPTVEHSGGDTSLDSATWIEYSAYNMQLGSEDLTLDFGFAQGSIGSTATVVMSKAYEVGTSSPTAPGATFPIQIWDLTKGETIANAVTYYIPSDGSVYTLDTFVMNNKYAITENLSAYPEYQLKGMKIDGAPLVYNAAGYYEFTATGTSTAWNSLTITNGSSAVPIVATMEHRITHNQPPINSTDTFEVFVWNKTAGETQASAQSYQLAPQGSPQALALNDGDEYYFKPVTRSGYRFEGLFADGAALVSSNDTFTVTARSGLKIMVEHSVFASTVLTKTIANAPGPAQPGDTFEVLVWDITKGQSQSDALSFTLRADGRTVSVPNLTNGSTYGIKENLPTDSVYERSRMVVNGTTISMAPDGSGQFVCSRSNVILIENRIPYANISIVKALNNQLPLSPTDSFTIKVWDITAGQTLSNATSYTLQANAAALPLNNIIPGHTYGITETFLTGSTGYSFIDFQLNNTILQSQNGYFIFTAPTTTSQITVTNRLNVALDGKVFLMVTMLEGQLTTRATETFDFYVWQVGSSRPILPNVKGVLLNGYVELDIGLVEGADYYIEEAPKADYDLYGMLRFVGTPIAEDLQGYRFTAPTSVQSGLIINAVNQLNYISGGATITKGMVADQQFVSPSDQFLVEIIPSFGGQSISVTLGTDGAQQNIDNLVPGQKYYIEEKSSPNNFYMLDRILLNGRVLSKEQGRYIFITPVNLGSTPMNFQVVNQLTTIPSGVVVMQKSIPDGPINPTDTFSIEITDTTTGIATPYTIGFDSESNAISMPIDRLVVGRQYTIRELIPSGSPYRYIGVAGKNVTVIPNAGSASFIIEKFSSTSNDIVLQVNNDYETTVLPSLPKIELRKTLRDYPFNEAPRFNFFVWRSDRTKPTLPNYSILADGTPVAIWALVPGAKYYIEESPSSGYALESLTVNGVTLQQESGKYYFTAPTDGSLLSINAVNRVYLLQPSTVSLKKMVAGRNPITTFHFDVWNSSGSKPTSANLTAKNDGIAMQLPQLVAGQKYYIEEQAIVDYTFAYIQIDGLPALQDSDGAYYFIAPSSDTNKMTIEVVNTYTGTYTGGDGGSGGSSGGGSGGGSDNKRLDTSSPILSYPPTVGSIDDSPQNVNQNPATGS